ncbi:MAG: carboxypeptidase-like regulatory domain-containing protein, partial [candidate division Zixibacteria bacterium]
DWNEELVHGIFIERNRRYELDLRSSIARTWQGEFLLPDGSYTLANRELYLRLDLFKRLFGLDLQFDFSQLRVFMKFDESLPAYQKIKRKLAQEKLASEVVAQRDVYQLPLVRPSFGGGVLDWVISANPLEREQYYDLTLGGVLLGGDFSFAGSGNSVAGFDWNRSRYRWHYFFDKSNRLTQLELGHVFSVGPLSRSLEGIMVSNRPQTQRDYFQTIRLNGNVGEDWEVELYAGERLIDFVHTDHTGEYNFNTDIVYGSTLLTLKLYGPNGEMRTEQKYVNIPYNLIPRNAIEYTVSAGRSRDFREPGGFGQAAVYYGVRNDLTFGLTGESPIGGSDSSRVAIAGDLTYNFKSNLTANIAVTPGDRIETSLNFRRISSFSVSAAGAKFFEDPIRNQVGRQWNFSLAASGPFRIGKRFGSVRANVMHESFRTLKITSMNYGVSASLPGSHINYIGQAKITSYGNRRSTSLDSKLIVSSRFPCFVRPQVRVDYDHNLKALTRYSLYLSKRVFRTGQATLVLERNQQTRTNQISFSLNFFTSFATSSSRVTRMAGEVLVSQVQRGSIQYDHSSKALLFHRRSGVGFSSAIVRPFIDRNYNGRYDGSDEYLTGLRAKIKGAGGRPRGDDRLYFYERLRGYYEYLVQIDPYSLDNPLLKPTHESYRVTLSPNVVTNIEVPLVMAGEVSGKVTRRTKRGRSGLGGVRIEIFNITKEIVTEVTTFNDGEFYYLGLLPGKYRAYISVG